MNDELLQKAVRKDPEAFTQLMQSYMQIMYKTARSILKSDDDAADAIQETILRCWEKIGSLKKPEFFKTWMIRVLVNCCYDQLRVRKGVPLADDDAGTDYDIPWHENSYSLSEWVQVLEKLDEPYRLVMVLYYIDDIKISDIAKLTDLSEGAVRTRLSRGRAMLCRELNEKVNAGT